MRLPVKICLFLASAAVAGPGLAGAPDRAFDPAQAVDPALMARAFKLGIEAGRIAYEAGIMARQDMAVPSTPVAGRPFTL